ncbi:hypothetical protein HDU81_004402 [Chytriomyces hyalinus]|nr:hypothetical protein HDU81_004402 [Chytriomyces hyalinus]
MTRKPNRPFLRPSRLWKTAILVTSACLMVHYWGVVHSGLVENSGTDSETAQIIRWVIYLRLYGTSSVSNSVFVCADSDLPWEHVCIIGNAQKEADAVRTHSMWNNQIPSFWFVWGEPISNPDSRPIPYPSNVHLVQTGEKKSSADGILYLLNVARENYDCEYIFTHDDDLSFYVKDEKDSRSLHQVLSDILLKYQPAVAGFPWTVGDSTVASMKSIAEHYKGAEVSPLTGFDSGMVLYHKSIVDFFIPYSPRGEGGFTGHWSLCAHFINLFAPHIFRGNAIRINAIGYTNLISFDNVPEEERSQPKVLKNGLISHGESRHPYEYHMNEHLKIFLSNGMKNRQQRWGRDMGMQDLVWNVELAPQYFTMLQLSADRKRHRSFDRWQSKNKWIRDSYSDHELNDFLDGVEADGRDFSFVIHIFTLNRQESFDKLWASINQAYRIHRPVSFHVHLDSGKADNNAPFFFYVEHLRGLVSPHGPVHISVSSSPKGLRGNIMDAWTPTSSNEYGIFLEDDISVSRHFLEFAEQMVSRYLHPRGTPGSTTKCIGISLYNQKFDEVNDKDWSLSTGPLHHPYLLQQPQSWGAVYAPEAWNDFRKWFFAQPPDFNPLIPNSMTNRWLKTKSWKKFLIRYMYAKGKFMVYPNIPGFLSLTTNRLEVGTNDKAQKGPYRDLMLKRFNVPLLDLTRIADSGLDRENIEYLKSVTTRDSGGKVRLDLHLTAAESAKTKLSNSLDQITPFFPSSRSKTSADLPPMDKLRVFNAYFGEVADFHALMEGITPKSFDKCTLILEPQHQDTKILMDQLQHYHIVSQLDAIFVVWDPIFGKAPQVNAPSRSKPKKRNKRRKKLQYDFQVPIEFIIPDTSSLSFKYKSITTADIQTDCIISASTEWRIPHYELDFAISMFQGHFFNHLIGFNPRGHSHVPSSGGSGEWSYVPGKSRNAVSLLATGFVHHRNYLGMSSSTFDRISDAASGEGWKEREDIMLNMIIANATNMGPVVIESPGLHPTNSSWRNEAVQAREICLGRFQKEVFKGVMPLRYSKNGFEPPKRVLKKIHGVEYPEQVTPALKKLLSVQSLDSLAE